MLQLFSVPGNIWVEINVIIDFPHKFWPQMLTLFPSPQTQFSTMFCFHITFPVSAVFTFGKFTNNSAMVIKLSLTFTGSHGDCSAHQTCVSFPINIPSLLSPRCCIKRYCCIITNAKSWIEIRLSAAVYSRHYCKNHKKGSKTEL